MITIDYNIYKYRTKVQRNLSNLRNLTNLTNF